MNYKFGYSNFFISGNSESGALPPGKVPQPDEVRFPHPYIIIIDILGYIKIIVPGYAIDPKGGKIEIENIDFRSRHEKKFLSKN